MAMTSTVHCPCCYSLTFEKEHHDETVVTTTTVTSEVESKTMPSRKHGKDDGEEQDYMSEVRDVLLEDSIASFTEEYKGELETRFNAWMSA